MASKMRYATTSIRPSIYFYSTVCSLTGVLCGECRQVFVNGDVGLRPRDFGRLHPELLDAEENGRRALQRSYWASERLGQCGSHGVHESVGSGYCIRIISSIS